jgi:hypothetical protein
MARKTKVINFSAPPALAKMIARQAKLEKKSKSELLRDAFESYMFEKRLRELQKVGQEIAEKLGLESYDDIEKYIEGE